MDILWSRLVVMGFSFSKVSRRSLDEVLPISRWCPLAATSAVRNHCSAEIEDGVLAIDQASRFHTVELAMAARSEYSMRWNSRYAKYQDRRR